MGVNVQLDGFGPVHRMKFYQGSEATPGRCVIDCATQENINEPRVTNLNASTVSDDGLYEWYGTWKGMRLVNWKRARHGHTHVVLEDSRWVMAERTLQDNYNNRDSSGYIYTSNKKSVTDLVKVIDEACGQDITIVPKSLPSFNPPARWANKTCAEAMQELLDMTGSRMVYQPETGLYIVTHAGVGPSPQFPNQVYQPVPKSSLKSIKFYTHPILHESRETVNAVSIDQGTGLPQNISSGTSLDLVSAPSHTAANQTKYRLWHDGANSDRKYVQHRPKSLLIDPENPQMEKGRIIRDDWEPFPVHQPIVSVGSEIVDMIELTSGGNVFVTNHPVLSASGNTYSTTATLLTGYYKQNGDRGLVREEEVVEIDPQSSIEKEIILDWIKPIDSSEPDVRASQWSSLLTSAATAIAKKYSPQETPAAVTSPDFQSLGGSGKVGAVEYEFQTHPVHKRHQMRVALNFTPGTEGSIR